MGDSSDVSALEKDGGSVTNGQPKDGLKPVKTVTLLVIGVLSIVSIVWICMRPWLYKVPEAVSEEPRSGELSKDTLLALAKQQHKLIVGQVIIKSLGWGSHEDNAWWHSKRRAVRAWTMRSKIDVSIDTSKLKEEAFDLLVKEDGTRFLKLRLPCPEIDKRQCEALQPNELVRIFNGGDLDSDADNTVRNKAFAMIKDNVRETVENNGEPIKDMAKISAAEAFRSLYTCLGVGMVDVEWTSEASGSSEVKSN